MKLEKKFMFFGQIFKITIENEEKKEYQKFYHEQEDGNMKNLFTKTRKNKYKSLTKQCNDIDNRQKRNCKKIHVQRKIKRKLKSKNLTDIQCNTQIKNVKCAKANSTPNCNIKKYLTYSKKDINVK